MRIPGETGYEDIIMQLYYIGLSLPENKRAALERLHKEHSGCNAHAEGLYCCVDFLLGDFKIEDDS
jgi:hypothetical protein